MPTIITHALAGAAIAQVLAPCSIRAQVTWIAAGCAMLPDVDGIGLRLGIPYDNLFGHRGITHSLLFAGLVAAVVTRLLMKKVQGGDLLRVLVCTFVATASHGTLDAFTNGGLGVAFAVGGAGVVCFTARWFSLSDSASMRMTTINTKSKAYRAVLIALPFGRTFQSMESALKESKN